MIENFGINVARLRKDKDMTQEDLADKLGVSKQTISNIEKGEGYPTFKNLEKISKILNASPIQLFGTMKEIAVSDTPEILNRIDEYDHQIKNVLKVADILDGLSIDKQMQNDIEAMGRIIQAEKFLDRLLQDRELQKAVLSLEMIADLCHRPVVVDDYGMPVENIDGKFITSKSVFEKLPFEQIEKAANQLKFILDNQDKLNY